MQQRLSHQIASHHCKAIAAGARAAASALEVEIWDAAYLLHGFGSRSSVFSLPEMMGTVILEVFPPPPPAHLFSTRSKGTAVFTHSSYPSPCLLPAALFLHFRRRSSSCSSLYKATPPTFESLDSIFLPFLQSQEEEEEEEERSEVEEGSDAVDAIHRFFKSRVATEDPSREGRVRLKKNRRLAWHIEDFGDEGSDDELLSVNAGEDDSSNQRSTNQSPREGEADEDEGKEEDDEGGGGEETEGERGLSREILRIAESMPPNATLGDYLRPYEGRIDAKECILVLRALTKEGLVMPALYFLEWLGLQGPELVTPRAYSFLFTALGKAGMGDRIMVLFNNMPKWGRFRDLHLYNSIISALSCCRRYQDAWDIYEQMEERNIQPDHVTCSILLTVLRKEGCDARDVWRFFETISGKGVKASAEVLGALVKSFCDKGLVKEALIIQSEMEKQGIYANVIVYNTLMDAYSKLNQIEEAEGLFLEMKEKGLNPTTATYNILMDAYGRRMQPDIVEDLLLEMQDLGLKPDVRSFTSLISAYGRKRKMSDLAADAFLRMRKAGISPTSHSYTALVHAYSIDGWHEKALKAFDDMKREGIEPSVETYTALLDAFRRTGDTKTLLGIWKTMVDDKIKGTRVTFNILLDGLAKQGHYAEARDVIHEFGKIGLTPTVMTYNMLMNAYARGGQHSKLPQLLKEMAVLNLKPDSVTYSTMIYAYVRVRDFKRAFYYHKQMVKSRQIPDARSYEKLRCILDVKAAVKNKRDRSAIMGIVHSSMGLSKPRRTKKDEFWKNKRKRSVTNKS
ncbi:Pentatricopeptide repeat-containing protein [Nymphaea thermarum]|nr:Pentatricopeptide repeat-containing protein [Nymphaea thermarum]